MEHLILGMVGSWWLGSYNLYAQEVLEHASTVVAHDSSVGAHDSSVGAFQMIHPVGGF